MKITDLNQHGEIGANSMFVQIAGFNILIDSGLHPKKMGYDAIPNFEPIENLHLDLIVLTHCHLDHVGSLPLVAAHNPTTPIITSAPNELLAPRMLRNSINVMKRQREEHGVAEYPLFLHRDVAQMAKQITIQRLNRGEIYQKGQEKIEVTLHSAGHVAGAVAVELVHKNRRIVFSGDVLFDDQSTLPGAQLPEGEIDTLILETTRGAKGRAPHLTRSFEKERLIEKVAEILDRGGSCLIPVFALGRMQELFQIIYEGRNHGRIPKTPVYAAGLGMDLCNFFDKIHRQTHMVQFDKAILDRMNVSPLEPNMRPGRDLAKKGLYIVSSGMMVEHTPSYKIAASLLPHAQNGLCFVGYCDPDTPGGQLLEQQDEATFFFDALDYSAPIRASIDRFDLSGHADRDELLHYACAVDPRAIVLTHGDQDARDWFSDQLTESLQNSRILDPEPSVSYEI